MDIGYFTYIGHTGTVVLPWGGGSPPSQVKNPWGVICNIKTNTIFNNMILQKVYQFLRLFTITKLLILIQSFCFTHILHSSESLVYNRFSVIKIWNYVEANVSINSSYTSFKNAIKCHLLGNNVNNLFRSVKFSH